MSATLVVLAAGASRRLGRCKALVPLGGRTPLERLLEAGRALDGAPPLVVAGADWDAIRAAAPAGVEVAHNETWERGRTGTVALAARLRPGLDLVLAPVDVPLVGVEVFAALERAWAERGAPARGWLAPAAGSPPRPGHPVVVGRELVGEAAAMAPDEPLRTLRARAEPLWMVAVATEAVLDDLDTPADLARLAARFDPR